MNPLSIFKRVHHYFDNENKEENLEDRKRDWLSNIMDNEYSPYDTSSLENTAESSKPSLSELAKTLKANKKAGMVGAVKVLSVKNTPCINRTTGYLSESLNSRWDFLTK